VSDLTSFKHARDFHLPALFQELDGFADVSLNIVFSDTRTNLYTLYILLLALLIAALLPFQILMLTVVNNSADWGLGGWADHHKIQTFILRHRKSHPALQNSKLRTVGSDHADVPVLQNASINFWPRFGAWWSSKACYVWLPLLLSYN
jgi:hypothetical protein